MKKAWLGGAVFFACVAQASVATATSPSQTCVLGQAPFNQRPIPANAPALAYWDDSAQGYVMQYLGVAEQGATKWSGGAALNEAFPAPQTFEVKSDTRLAGGWLLVPTPGWEPGWRYELPGEASCGTTKVPSGHSVFTQAAAELPTSIGTVSAEPNATNGTNLRIHPTSELAAYQHVTMFELVVDGVVWSQVPYGVAVNGENLDLFVGPRGAFHGRPKNASQTLCAPGENGVRTQRFELRAHVAGASLDPAPVTIDAPFRCSTVSTVPSPPSSGDNGANGEGSPSGSSASSSAPPASESGCALALPAASRWGFAWAPIGLAALLAVLRRRRR